MFLLALRVSISKGSIKRQTAKLQRNVDLESHQYAQNVENRVSTWLFSSPSEYL